MARRAWFETIFGTWIEINNPSKTEHGLEKQVRFLERKFGVIAKRNLYDRYTIVFEDPYSKANVMEK